MRKGLRIRSRGLDDDRDQVVPHILPGVSQAQTFCQPRPPPDFVVIFRRPLLPLADALGSIRLSTIR
jgi:hypothetical protein